LLAFVIIGHFTPWLDFRTSTILFLAQCAIAGAIGAVGLWRHALTVEERGTLALKFCGLFSRRNFGMSDPLVSIILRSYNESWALSGTLSALANAGIPKLGTHRHRLGSTDVPPN